MRPNQNRRMRGRNRSNTKGPNPLTRAYESNGPDVKIRGTAQHIAEKYAQLARDAQASGDPVMAENYFQHGEHYFRIITAANEQYRQQYGGTYGRPGFDDEDDGDDEGVPTNGYAVQDRGQDRNQDRGQDRGNGNGYAQSGYGAADDYGDPAQQPQPYDSRGEDRPSRYERQDRSEHQRQDRPDRQERRERFQQNRQDRQDRPERQQRDRQDRGERQDRQDRQPRAERQDLSRTEQPRQDDGRQDSSRQDSPRQDAARQDAPRQEGYREGGRSEFRRERRREEPRAEPVLSADEPTGLPAFLTTPVRPAAPGPAPVEDAPPAPPATPVEAADEAPAPRPRRRRRTRFEGAEGGGEPSAELFPKPSDASGE